MKKIRVFAIGLLLASLSSCASMNKPSSTLIDTKPVIEIGSDSPAPEDHIVFIPANKAFPVYFTVEGDIFNDAVSSKSMVSLKQDIYLYKYWASLDGKKWVNSHELMRVEPSGGFDESGGKVDVKLNLMK